MKNHDQTQAPNHLDVAMGLHIRARRKSLAMSQTTLAEAVGLTFQQIQKYERGFNRVSFSRLVEIAHALDCRVVDLIAGLDDSSVSRPLLQDQNALLSVNGVPELLAAYTVMPPSLRRAVLKLAVELAKEQRSRGVEGGISAAA
jgi:transcriptional regulator with XRE-family HTH domain